MASLDHYILYTMLYSRLIPCVLYVAMNDIYYEPLCTHYRLHYSVYFTVGYSGLLHSVLFYIFFYYFLNTRLKVEARGHHFFCLEWKPI